MASQAIVHACLRVCAAVRGGGLFDRALAAALRGSELSDAERAEVVRTLHAFLRRERLIGFLLARARGPRARPLPPGRADRLSLAALAVLGGEAPRAAARRLGLREGEVGALGRLRGEQRALAALPAQERIALEQGLPPLLVAGLARAFGADAAAEAAALNEGAPLVVRVNTLRASREELAERLAREDVAARPTALSPLGLALETRRSVYGLPAFRAGWLEIQDEGSQLLGLLVDAPPRTVVDLCAGAGGKTLQLAAQMRNRGELFAFDPSEPALAKLRRRARRAGVHCVRAARLPRDEEAARTALADLRGRAWRVLVDAPCSGTGALRRNPDARLRFDAARLALHVALQRALLERAAPLVRPGGRIVYGTCSVLVEENEDVVEAFLAGHPELALRPAGEVLGPALAARVTRGPFLRVSPRRHGTDGFFGAVLERRNG